MAGEQQGQSHLPVLVALPRLHRNTVIPPRSVWAVQLIKTFKGMKGNESARSHRQPPGAGYWTLICAFRSLPSGLQCSSGWPKCNLLTVLPFLFHSFRRGNKTRDFSLASFAWSANFCCQLVFRHQGFWKFYIVFLSGVSWHINGSWVPPCQAPGHQHQCWWQSFQANSHIWAWRQGTGIFKNIYKTKEIPYIWSCSYRCCLVFL